MQNDLFLKIQDLEGRTSGIQKKLGQYFLTNFEEIAFQTVADAAQKSGTSQASIVRFSRALGFQGFSDLKDALRRLLLKKLSPSERLRRTARELDGTEDVVAYVFEREIENLKEAQKRLQSRNLKRVVHAIIKARKKYIVGIRATGGPAYLLGYYLNYILPDVVTITEGDSVLFEKLKSINEQDVLVAISYPRYTKATIEAMKLAINRRATTISITDSDFSPAARLADFALIAPSHSTSFSNSYTACLCMVDLLLTLITHIAPIETGALLKEMDDVLVGFDLFFNSNSREPTMV